MSTMTVEHSHIEHIHTQRQTLLDQLKEITGVEDEAVLEHALQASRTEAGKFDLTHAVNILVDENAVRCNDQNQEVVTYKTGAKDIKQSETKVAENVIDLTNEGSEKEALQRAIALSLQEQQHGMLGGQVTAEEQDISKVLEQSLAEAKAGTKRKRGEVWQDPLNPHDRKRLSDWPVGLKNVGNTCWFSAVIQSLFHLPVFQQLVLNFTPPNTSNEASFSYTNGHRNLVFMQELRRLFALMAGSHRKYVDPSKAVDILKEAFQPGSSDSQQDVSEFTHKLLEWLEDAFRSDCYEKVSSPHRDKLKQEQDATEKSGSNPMVDLFYGRFRSEGHNEGHLFSNEETFGQYPLQVNGFSNIHESLEAATAQEIETTKPNQEVVIKSGQEHWFTKLPPVLLFELSRFQFNQHLGRPEKIHNKFDFPEIIYMDRYIEVNKNITKTKRDEVRKLKETREELQGKLEKFLSYGSGSKRFPLQDVLQYALEFVESKQETTSTTPPDIDMASPCSISSMTMDSPCNSPVKSTAVDVGCQAQFSWKSASPASGDRAKIGVPAPRHVSETELRVLQSCLKRWRTEVESDVRKLQENVNTMDAVINNMYNEQSLQKVPYRLHAVLVHEGQAASGHYWAYVFNHRTKIWLKFNDITVTETTWEELQKESMGGYHNASAYCLMYIDCNRKELVEDFTDKEVGQNSKLENLPLDIRQLVSEDNRLFQKELVEWDLELRRMKDAASSSSETVAEKEISTQHGDEYEELIAKASYQALSDVMVVCSSKGPETALNEALSREQNRLQQQVQQTTNCERDNRLEHVLVYILLLQPHVPIAMLRANLLEQFAALRVDEENSSIALMRKVAEIRLKNLLMSSDFRECETLYRQYLEDYTEFRRLITYFIVGFERYQNLKYEPALPYLVKACCINDALIKKYENQLSGFDHAIALLFRRRCLLQLNNEALTRFENDDMAVVLDGLKLMNSCVVPCMNFLSAPNAPMEDSEAAEKIRASWCSKLGEEITSPKQEQLQELLSKLLDPLADQEMKWKTPLPTHRYSARELSERFAYVITQVRELMNSDENR